MPDTAFHNLSVDVYGGYAADSAINFFCVCAKNALEGLPYPCNSKTFLEFSHSYKELGRFLIS